MEVFVRHPILAAMVNLALALLGLFCFTRLGVDELPAVDQPYVTVSTSLQGASPLQVETSLTMPIEDAVAMVDGVQQIRSTSMQGMSVVDVQFESGRDAESVLQQCRDRVEALTGGFPQGTDAPTLARYSSTDEPVLSLTVSGKRSGAELTDLASRTILPRLSSVPGVADVGMAGGAARQVQVLPDPRRLLEQGLAITDVEDALQGVGGEIPGGWITSRYSESLLQISTRMPNVAAFGAVLLKDDGGAVVRIRDVAEVVDGVEERRSLALLDGQETLTLQIQKESDANLVEVADGVRAALADLRRTLPPDVAVQVLQDSSADVRAGVDEMLQHLVLGGLLACAVVLVFLGSARMMLIAALAIPVSILSSFILMDALDYTLNDMTLLALTLAVGLVIDDAVVVLENVWRQVEEKGLAPREAALAGMREIRFAVLATTLSLVILFLPLSLMPGQVGAYFRSWGVVLAFALTVSMFVSFSLTPMLCAVLLRPGGRRTLATRAVEAGYGRLLDLALRFRPLVLLLCLGSVLWGVQLFREIPKEFLAPEDDGQYSLQVTLPRGWSLPRVAETLQPLADSLRALPGVRGVLTTVDSGDLSQATLQVLLVPYAERRPLTQWESQAAARALLARYPLLSTLSGSPDFSLSLQGDDLALLEGLAERMVRELRATPGFQGVQSSLQGSQPDVTVRVDPLRAADLGVDAGTAGRAVRAAVGGVRVGNWTSGDQVVPLVLRLPAPFRDTPESLQDLRVPGAHGLVPLPQVATVTRGFVPAQIERFQRRPTVTVQADLGPGLSLDQAYARASAVQAALHMPPGYGSEWSGAGQLMQQTGLYALEAFLLSVVLVYMVLASQFENLLDPLIVLLTLPLAAPFALISLQAAGMSLNLFSVLGLFLLFGIVKKNAILQLDRTNELLAAGAARPVVQANRERLRPILMTTLTLVVAMIPAALVGPTGATRAPMAVVVVGGQSLCLLLTLLLIPVVSSYVKRAKA